MRLFFFLFLFSVYAVTVIAQQDVPQTSPTDRVPQVYAVVVGVARYQDPDIQQLQFANRDAAAFADYLMSASGGSVPKKQIRLLTDTAATIGEVDKALRWVLNNCKENDRVYFYFSGHGEIENYTISKNGYLICYNTPSVAFVNMGLSIDYLNDVVNTLSVRSKAKVILITDACHSGTAAGNRFKGNFFVGEQLMLKKANEIRMASSKPDQLSNERVDWGDGRGVFSYYLLNGLQGGLADENKDKAVSVGELKNYLEHKLANDPVLKSEGDVQTPVIVGDARFTLANIAEAEAKQVAERAEKDSVNIMMAINAMEQADAAETADPEMYFFDRFKKLKLEDLTNRLALNNLANDDIAFAIIKDCREKELTETGQRKFEELVNLLKQDREIFNRFNLDLASAFLDIGQNIIAAYIRGDEAELERRRYYNSSNNNYDVYVRIFEVASKLSQSDRYNSTNAAIFLHYFSGLAMRIKIPMATNPASLIEKAMAEQNKALALVDNAAYIYNELGVLYQYKKDYKTAEKYYSKAAQLSPRWAIPYANLSSVSILKKEYQKALQFVDQADSLQNNLQSTSVHRGYIHEMKSNLLLAEEEYQKAIDINERHFAPFERLGYLYMNSTNYALADSFYFESALRKKGYHFVDADGVIDYFDKEPSSPDNLPGCSFSDTLKFMANDMLAWFAWGLAEFYAMSTGPIDENGVAPHINKNNAGAIQHFRKVIKLDKKNPLVYHYLGIVYYQQHQWEEAELMFRYALENYMTADAFNNYLDSVKQSVQYPYEHSCYEELFKNHYYQQKEDLYFLASIYEKWGQPVEAGNFYKRLIEYDPVNLSVYLKLSQLLEKQSLYLPAENVLKQGQKYNPDTIYRQLNAFYRRVIEKEPDKGEWSYKLGLLLYDHARENYNQYDTIVWSPKDKKEEFAEPYTDMVDSNYVLKVPGTGERLYIEGNVLFPRLEGIRFLKRAAELIGEKETVASIHYKIGELYIWTGSKKLALPYFEKSLELVPDNVNTRLALINIYTFLLKNSKALFQLNYLSDKNLINFNLRLQLARFAMLAGNFTDAHQLLRKADTIQPYVLPQILQLYGLVNLLGNKPKEAISAYQKCIVVQPTDSLFNNYTLARLYAKSGNKTQAWKYLNRAVDLGFNYSFVLQNDSYMDSLRKTAKWQTMISGINMKKYKNETPAN